MDWRQKGVIAPNNFPKFVEVWFSCRDKDDILELTYGKNVITVELTGLDLFASFKTPFLRGNAFYITE